MAALTLSRPRRALILFSLGALTAFGPFTIDSYLPAFPQLVRGFEATDAAVQATLAGTMIGFAIGQLVVGPLSDHIGRRIPLLIGCAAHIVASLAVASSSDLAHFGLARGAQGFAAASSAVISLAIARDLFSGVAMLRALSMVALVSSFAPLVAPVVGSQLLAAGGWQLIFVFLACYAAAAFILSWVALPESLPPQVRRERGATTAFARYRLLLRDRGFVALMLLGGLRFTALFAYLQTSPFLFQRTLGLSETHFGVVFAIVTLGMMAGLQASSRLARRWPPRAVLAVSLSVLGVAGVALLAAHVDWGVAAFIAICTLFLFGCGLGLPMIQTLALLDHPAEAATAAALIGATSFGLAGLLSPAVALVPQLGLDLAQALGVTIVVCAALSAAILALAVRPTAALTSNA